MEKATYRNSEGHELRVVEIDNEGKRVRVDYGNGHFHWWGESDYVTWTKDGEEPKQETELVKDAPKKRQRKKSE